MSRIRNRVIDGARPAAVTRKSTIGCAEIGLLLSERCGGKFMVFTSHIEVEYAYQKQQFR